MDERFQESCPLHPIIMAFERAVSALGSSLLSVLVYVFLSSAQVIAPTTCLVGWEWTYNSLNQTPCVVAAYLEAVCNGGQYGISSLIPGNHYIGPNGPDNGDLCKCNTVSYSLISACDACQGSTWTQWSEWSLNCSSVSADGTYPRSIPSGTRVPGWAYLNVTKADIWNNTIAFESAVLPESSATRGPASINPSTSQTSSVSVTATSSMSSSAVSSPQNASSSSHSHAGAIAGGVVGGVVGAALLAGLVVCLVIRHRRSRVPPSATYGGGPSPVMGQDVHNGALAPFAREFPETPRRFYDPSDPSTFPTSPSPSSPMIHTNNNTYNTSMHNLQPNRSQYNGLPESHTYQPTPSMPHDSRICPCTSGFSNRISFVCGIEIACGSFSILYSIVVLFVCEACTVFMNERFQGSCPLHPPSIMAFAKIVSALGSSLLPVLAYVVLSSAQIIAPTTCVAGWEWTYNSLNQTPCVVAAYLEAVCNNGQFGISSLIPGNHYIGPNGPGNGDLCACNTVSYSLISACDACQGSIWTQWSEWSFNCSSVSADGTYPRSIPSGTRVPGWAYLNVTKADIWNNTIAFESAALPESSATGGPTTINPSASQTSSVSVTATSSTSSSAVSSPQNASSSSHSHAGAIAGGVVGGVVGAALLAGLVAFLAIRHRRSRVPPSATYGGGPPPDMGQDVHNGALAPFLGEFPETPRKFYVCSVLRYVANSRMGFKSRVPID
ncbi:hypothetical protein EW146_g3301 [Bondarzewia mesenterica]|uniref:Uncharacterized protein n=1 Tax=Bondarzewia mesenterica TaxID=1095465 RepID=A0A4S4LZF2_9AGAM|nr:hypothetical protein EW146_g3301 [Bondarzewia mesenterica]